MTRDKVKKDTKKEIETLYSAIEQTDDTIFITNKDGIIEYINPAFSKLTGFSKREAIGKTPRIIKSGLQSEEHYKKLWSTILSGKTFRSVVVNKKKNKELFYADHTITPIKDSKGDVIRFVGIWKDITEQVILEKRKDEFISIASHELKTPITSIKAFFQIIQKKIEKYKDKELFYFICKIDNQLNKLTLLINELLDVSKIQSGKLRLDYQKFSLDELIDEVILDFKYSSNKYKIGKEGKINKNIYADRYRIEQVFVNLLNNAIRYSHDSNKITIKTLLDKNRVKVAIEDFGEGIDSIHREKIFERFYQVNGSAYANSTGLGMGLYISSQIIKNHGGEIWVESKKGEGSTFYFTIPV